MVSTHQRSWLKALSYHTSPYGYPKTFLTHPPLCSELITCLSLRCTCFTRALYEHACCFITNSTKTWHVGWVSPCVHSEAWHKYVGFLWYGQTCCKHSFPYVSCNHIHTYKPPHTNAHMSTHAHTHTLLIVYVYNWSYCNDCLCNMHCNICFDNTF